MLNRRILDKYNWRRTWRRFLITISIWLGGGVLINPAAAQNAGLGDLAQANLNLGNEPLIEIVARIINITLGVLGVIAVLLILYAGFIWLTSAGNEEKISKAKKILSGAVIGLIIILSSFALASFIIKQLTASTTGGPSGPVLCADGFPPPCLGFDRLQVTSVSPRHQEEGVKLCRRVQAQFNEKLDPATVKSSSVKIWNTQNTPDLNDDAELPGTFVVKEKVFSFRHADFAPTTRYRAVINSGSGGVKDIRNRFLREDKKWHFTTGSETDAVLPQVVNVYPAAGSTEACRETAIQVVFSEEMDSTTLNRDNIILQDGAGVIIPLGDIDIGSDFKSVTVYAASTLSSNTSYTVTLKSGPTGITDACGNPLDGNKNGAVDSPPQDDYSWSFTTGETAVCQPILATLTPNSGHYGEILTLTGKNLALTGEVLFNDFPADSNSLDIPPTDNIICWGMGSCPVNTIKVKVPVGFLLGATPAVAVKVKVGREQSESKDFTLLSPHIRVVNPNHGPAGQFVTVFGLNFGTTPGTVKFGASTAELACVSSDSWTDREIVVKTPSSLTLGDYEVQVTTANNKPSNKKDFTVDNSSLAPGLCAVRPHCADKGGGKIDEIEGVRFGASRGASVVNLAGYNIAPQGAWSDSLIKNVSVPAALGDDNHLLRVIVNNQASNAKYYDIPCLDVSYPRVIEDQSCQLYSQSPSPWQESKDVCRNVLISARFSEPMQAATLTASNIKLYQCGQGDSFISSSCNEKLTVENIGLISGGETNDKVGFYGEPSVALMPNYWYEATVTTGVSSAVGVPMRQDYKWHWRVRSDANGCAVSKVMCAPPTAIIRSLDPPDNSRDYSAQAVAANCNLLNNQNYDWTWSSSDEAKARLTIGTVKNQAQATALDWTEANNPVKIKSRLANENKEAICDLSISATACREDKQCGACGAGASSCVNNNCTPVITDFSPPAGAIGTWLGINGCYFGNTKGKVVYQKSGGGEVEGLWPDIDICGNTWSNNQIISEIPPLTDTGKFKVTRPSANPGEAESPAAFTVNNVNYPGLCRVEPSFIYEAQLGTSAAQIELSGKGFGASRGTSDTVNYYQPNGVTLSQKATDYPAWTMWAIKAITPVGTAVGRDKVAVQKDSELSNKINLRIYPGSPPPGPPVVSSITPPNGRADNIATTLVSINGSGFGTNQGSSRVLLKAVSATGDWVDNAKDYDFNNDKILTQADVSLLISQKEADINQGENRKFDVNNDGKIDDDDEELLADYLASHPREYGKDYTIEAAAGCGWSDSEIVAKMPTTLTINEQWRVVVKTSSGESVNPNVIFTVSNIIHPGICTITPNHGKSGTQVVINGINFGDIKSASQAIFTKYGGTVAVADKYIKQWRNTTITLTVPDVDICGDAAVCPVKIKTGPVKVTVNFPPAYGGQQQSNPVIFYAEPFITSLNPVSGPASTWLTIKGGNFGECASRGVSLSGPCVVTFAAGKETRILEASLPVICGNTWQDSEIVTKAPPGGVTGLVKVRTEYNLETDNSTSKVFTYNSALPLAPGLCKLEPDNATKLPAAVALRGDGFGAVPRSGDNVQFSNKLLNTWSSWQNQTISLSAPRGTITGDVFVRRQQRVSTGVKCDGVIVAGKCLGKEEPIYQDIVTVSNPREFQIREKPKVTGVKPIDGASNVCRNAPIIVTFDRPLPGISPLPLTEFKVKKCLKVTKDTKLELNKFSYFWRQLNNGLWQRLWPFSKSAGAVICSEVAGSLLVRNNELLFIPSQPLAPETNYTVELSSYNIDCSSFCSWQFTTQDKICQIDKVEVFPARHTFTKAGAAGEKEFTARARASDGQELVANYAWSKSDKDNVVNLGSQLNMSSLNVTANAKSGQAMLKVEADGTASQAGKKTGQANLEVFICDFPWQFSDVDENMRLKYCRGNLSDVKFSNTQLLKNPDFENELQDWSKSGQWQAATFKQQGAKSAANTAGSGELFQTVNVKAAGDYLLTGYIYYNGALQVSLGANEQSFSGNPGSWEKITISAKAATTNLTVKFIALAGQVYVDNLSLKEITGLLPELHLPQPPFTREQGDLLREYFFSVDGSSDVFGLRVYKNFSRLSPLDWYNSRTDINKGSPKKIKDIDGYEAIQDGNTYYVSAVKQSGTTMYTNMYVLSFNQGALPVTSQLAAKLLAGWQFNTNIDDPAKLASLKRDIKRVQDLESLKKLLRAYKTDWGEYPSLPAGTFKVGQTTSVWPSWQSTLGNDLGRALPVDPLNNFADAAGNNLCQGAGYEGYDPITCWNSSSKDFKCPDGSHIYQYRAGTDHIISLNFEYKGVIWPGVDAREDINTGPAANNTCQSFQYNFDKPSVPRPED